MREEIYRKAYQILSSDTDCLRRLRLSRLFTFLQEAAIAHTEALGMGRAKTLDKGLLWIVTLQQAKITRLPVYDEQVTLESAPGQTMHTFFPRYYRLTDESGNELVNAAALWALMDCETRAMVFPEKHGIRIDAQSVPWKTFLPRPPKLPENAAVCDFTVPYSYVDLNGHMNNTRYFDLAEDLLPDEVRKGSIREILTEYTGEAKPGETLRLELSRAGGEVRLCGTGQKRLFRISMQYDSGGETLGLSNT